MLSSWFVRKAGEENGGGHSLNYRAHSKGSYGNIRRHRTVSKAEQDRRFREASAFELSHGGSLRSVRARLATHKLCGNTH
jgi:hypothetical protein